MTRSMQRQQFLNDVNAHQMTVLRDDWNYRHLKFSKPKSSVYWFEIVTWPGFLCINGDMGTWTFSRTTDMFALFRPHDGVLAISPSYWAEKLRHGAGPAYESAREFRIDTLRWQAFAHLDNWDLSEKKTERVKQALEENVLCLSDSEEYEALGALYSYHWPHGVLFDPVDGPFGYDFSHHYIWCCWAIAWAIQQYDQYKTAP